jgi:hypothetical protein
MRDAYRGPAVLVASGTEFDVDADLWLDEGHVDTSSILEHGGAVVHSYGLRSWGGHLTFAVGDSAFGVDQGALRLPDGGEGRVILSLYGVSADRDRVEVRGTGPAPFPI